MLVFAAGAGLNPLNVNPGLIIWTLIVFLGVVLVLKFAAWGPLMKALDARADKVHSDLESAARDREEAEKKLAEAKTALDKQLSEAQAIISEGKRDANALKEDILSKARTEANELQTRAIREIEQAKVKAVSELEGTAVELAVELASKLIGEKISAESHRSYLEKVLKEYKELN